jgi:hypothetical protein
MKGKDVKKYMAEKQKTYQTAGVTFVVKQLTTWILAKIIGDEVIAVNACYMPFLMSKHKLVLLLLGGMYHLAYL